MTRRPFLLHKAVPPAVYTPPFDASRIPEIDKWIDGQAKPVPQSYYDGMAADFANTNTHPHLGPFTHTAIASGSWSNPAIWSTGTVPDANAAVDIDSFTVVYDLESDVKIKEIHVEGTGTLKWATNKDTRLWVDTIMCHGTFIMGTGSAPITDSRTKGKPRAEIVFWQAQAPLATTRLGLNTMGACCIQGQAKTPHLRCPVNINAGATSVTIAGLKTANWRVGDNVLFVATDNAGVSSSDPQYTGPTQFYGPYIGSDGTRFRDLGYHLSHDEVRTITGISGNTLTWDSPLAHSHTVTADTLPHGQAVTINPVVANLSRSIRFRSADPSSLQTRAHTMFMFSDILDVRYAEAFNMARTDTNPSLARPDGEIAYRTADTSQPITDVNNVRGRYAFHAHGTGPYFGRKMGVFKGLTAWAPTAEVPQPGWSITHHNSRMAVEDCVVYNARGAGIVSELGNEAGQWVNNVVAWVRGDGFDVSWFSRAELWQNHNGHAGVAYESQARQILQQGNVASSVQFGWAFLQQNTGGFARIPDIYSLRLYDSFTQGDGLQGGPTLDTKDTYGIEEAQIPDFDDNTCFGVSNAFMVSHRQFTDRTDMTPLISRRFNCIAVRRAFYLINYSFHYSFYDFLWTGTGVSGAKGASIGNVSWNFNFINGSLRDFDIGFEQNGSGFNYAGFWVDLKFANVTTHFTHFYGDFDITAWQAAHPGKDFATQHDYAGVMGPWITDPTGSIPGVHWKGILREWKAISSATDLPQPYPALPQGQGGIEPLPGTPKPYFYLDPASDVTISDITGSVNWFGVLVDNLGVRSWPDEQSSEGFSPATTFVGRWHRTNEALTATSMVQRNGCFLDHGVWKSRCWFADHERLSGEYFQFYVDFTLQGLAPDFLNAHIVDPNSTKPTLPLVLESVPAIAPPIVLSTESPAITSINNPTVAENYPLAHILKADDGLVKWSITGGADAARFEINASSGVFTLRWTGNGTKDFEGPTDADNNNVYEVQVTATNQLGYSSSQALSVTVSNKTETVVSPFSDNFNRATQNLEDGPNWFRIGGLPGQLVVSGNRIVAVNLGTEAAYVSPDTGSLNHYVQMFLEASTGSAWVAASVTDSDNFIGVRRNFGTVNLVKRVAGVQTTLGNWGGASSNATIRLEYTGGVATVIVDGVTRISVAVGPPPPATTRVGIVMEADQGNIGESYTAGAM